ncbi:hypothetical protein ACW2Q0_12125 [Nocardia sp. R16R-3T]
MLELACPAGTDDAAMRGLIGGTLGHPIGVRSLPLEIALACVATYGADALP